MIKTSVLNKNSIPYEPSLRGACDEAIQKDLEQRISMSIIKIFPGLLRRPLLALFFRTKSVRRSPRNDGLQGFCLVQRIKARIVLFLMSVLLFGCSMEGTDDFGSYYQKQTSLDLLKMPPGVTAEKVDNYYVVPPGPMADVKTVSILPPGSRAFNSALKKAAPKSPHTTQTTQPVEAASDTVGKSSNDN